jgi:hypothetical protein
MKRVTLVFLTTLFACLLSTSVTAATYDHEVTAKDMTFAWKVDGDTLHAKMSAKTKGWVGVGFNPSNKMKDANFILGYVKDGKAEVVDHFGTKATGHDADSKNGGSDDVTLVAGTEDNGLTTIEFTMPINSGDKMDSALNADGDTILLLAYGPDRDSLKPRHKFKTTMTVNLSTGASK